MILRGSESTASSRQPDGWMTHSPLAGNVPGEQENEPAERIDLILFPGRGAASTALASSSSSSRASASHTPSSSMVSMPGFLDVVLVLDLADDLLDHVLDGDQALGPAELVDDDGEVDALRPHPREQVDHAHRFRDEQGLAHQRRRSSGRALGSTLATEDVLDVNHADDLVEAFAIDGQAAVPGVGEGADQLVEADRRRHRDDVAAGDADVARGPLAEVEQVAEHLPLGRRQVAGDRARVLGLVDRFLDLVAKRRLAVVAEDQGAHSAPQPRAALVVPRRHQSADLVRIGDAEAGERADLARFHVGGVARRP